MSSTRQCIQAATAQLKQAGCDAPKLEAELLLMLAWSITRTDLIIRAHDEVPDNIQNHFNTLIKRRQQREPLAYILGEKEFWSRSFKVTPAVLIPRPETEHLIEAVLEYFPDQQAPYCFYDIGTGSGCIAITLACEYPHAHIIATDISKSALDIAQHNALLHHVAHRITFRQGDMLLAVQGDATHAKVRDDASDTNYHTDHRANYDGNCDAIISNPPYVTLLEMDHLEPELSHEPRHALTDDADGLRFLSNILQHAPQYLKTSGLLILETGPCGLPDTPACFIFKQHIHDLAGHARGGVYSLKPSMN